MVRKAPEKEKPNKPISAKAANTSTESEIDFDQQPNHRKVTPRATRREKITKKNTSIAKTTDKGNTEKESAEEWI